MNSKLFHQIYRDFFTLFFGNPAAEISSVYDVKRAAVVPCHTNAGDIIDILNGSLCADRRSLYIVHGNQFDAASDRVLFSDTKNGLAGRESVTHFCCLPSPF